MKEMYILGYERCLNGEKERYVLGSAYTYENVKSMFDVATAGFVAVKSDDYFYEAEKDYLKISKSKDNYIKYFITQEMWMFE